MLNENDGYWITMVCFQYLDIHLSCYMPDVCMFSSRGSFNLFNENNYIKRLQASKLL